MSLQTEVQVAKREKPSLWGMLFAPGPQFRRIRENPRVLVPLLWATLLLAALTGLFFYQLVNDEFIAQMKNAIPAGEEEIDPVLLKNIFGIVGVVFGLFFIPISFVIGAVLMKICMVIVGNDTPFKTLLSMTVYTSMVLVPYYVVNSILLGLFGFQNGVMSFTSLAGLFPAGGVLAGAAGAFDVFYLWMLALTAMGLQTVAGLSKQKAYTVTGVLFVLLLILMALGGLGEPAAV